MDSIKRIHHTSELMHSDGIGGVVCGQLLIVYRQEMGEPCAVEHELHLLQLEPIDGDEILRGLIVSVEFVEWQ